MTNYQNGKIYQLIDLTNGNKYIGSTTQKLGCRLSGHKTDYKLKPEKNVSSGLIFKNNNYKIELIENYPCNTKRELDEREQYFLDTIECVNIHRAFMTKENRLEMNRICDKKRTRDYKPYLKQYRDYRSSWGGDARTNNNLLLIDLSIFS